ncbi:MAG: hypothetical protein ACRDRN_21540 [Sciscionella sp.]
MAVEPANTTVLVALADTGDASALCACPHVNFHTSPNHAQAYLAHHPELTGEFLLAQHPAIEYERGIGGRAADSCLPDRHDRLRDRGQDAGRADAGSGAV